MLHGETVILLERTQTGTDAFNRPVYATTEKQIGNVLIAPASSTDITTNIDMTGKRAVYTLGIPKGDTNDWADHDVKFWGKTWHVFAFPTEGIDALIPLAWNRKVMVELIE